MIVYNFKFILQKSNVKSSLTKRLDQQTFNWSFGNTKLITKVFPSSYQKFLIKSNSSSLAKRYTVVCTWLNDRIGKFEITEPDFIKA